MDVRSRQSLEGGLHSGLVVYHSGKEPATTKLQPEGSRAKGVEAN